MHGALYLEKISRKLRTKYRIGLLVSVIIISFIFVSGHSLIKSSPLRVVNYFNKLDNNKKFHREIEHVRNLLPHDAKIFVLNDFGSYLFMFKQQQMLSVKFLKKNNNKYNENCYFIIKPYIDKQYFTKDNSYKRKNKIRKHVLLIPMIYPIYKSDNIDVYTVHNKS